MYTGIFIDSPRVPRSILAQSLLLPGLLRYGDLFMDRDVVWYGVDFEEVVQHDHQHGGAAEEEREGVELGVGDHGCVC
jgi:hypothetical protein